MNLDFHKNVCTARTIRKELHTSTLPQKVQAKKYNLNHSAMRKWHSREDSSDHCCTSGKRKPTGTLVFDTACDKYGIEHPLNTPGHPLSADLQTLDSPNKH